MTHLVCFDFNLSKPLNETLAYFTLPPPDISSQAQHVAPLLNHYQELLNLCTNAAAASADALTVDVDNSSTVATHTNTNTYTDTKGGKNNKEDGNRRGDSNNKGDHKKADASKKGDTSKRGDISRRGVDVDIDAQVDVLWSFLEQLPNGHGVPQGDKRRTFSSYFDHILI